MGPLTKADTLTTSQRQVYDNVIQFLVQPFNKTQPTSYLITITGQAGTGKTFLTKKLLNYVRGTLKQNVLAVAPTHKARRVLERTLNVRTFAPITTATVASLLSKVKAFSYVGTKRYVGGGDNKVKNYDVLLIDEISMVSRRDYHAICQLAQQYERKIIFIGDQAQIPSPSEPLAITNGSLIKPDSPAFKLDNVQRLTELVRQASHNPLCQLYSLFRTDNPAEPIPLDPVTIPHQTDLTEEGLGLEYTSSKQELVQLIVKAYRVAFHCPAGAPAGLTNLRVICYTNNAVQEYNRIIRKECALCSSPFNPGELLMAYCNKRDIIENSQDYLVVEVETVTNHTIVTEDQQFTGLSGHLVKLKDVDTLCNRYLFFPDIIDQANYELLFDLIERAERLNRKGSTRQDQAKYFQLSNQISFMSDVYRYDGRIISQSDFQTAHPLLFTRVADIIDDKCEERAIIETLTTQQLDSRYPSLVQYRAEDDKPVGDSELFSDRYMVVEKSMDYGYAITAHKSQGSTYQQVFIDETDFEKLSNRWNHRFRLQEKRSKERNQLLYVAYSRPKLRATVLFRP